MKVVYKAKITMIDNIPDDASQLFDEKEITESIKKRSGNRNI